MSPSSPVEVLTGRPTRVYINGWRIHHGLAGLALIALGLALAAHDWRDRPWRLRLGAVAGLERAAELAQ